MSGKMCMITGGNSGIGKATAQGLAAHGAKVIIVCRNKTLGEETVQEIKEKTKNPSIDLLIADLSSQESIRALVKEFKSKYDRLDVLINNAGVLLLKRETTVDRIETTLATNYLAPFLLTNLLLDVLKKSAPSRIINVTSVVHKVAAIDFEDLQGEKNYKGLKAYSQSKLALVLFTHELSRMLKNSSVTVNCLHPGIVKTNITRHFPFFMRIFVKLFKTAKRGAKTSIYLAFSPHVEGVTGKYFSKKKEKKPSKESNNEEDAKKLWDLSLELTKL